MSEPKKCLFREVGSEAFVEVNPLAVRLLRQIGDATEIVFDDTHSIKVKSSRVAVSATFEGRNAWTHDVH